jgi:hypothetical protein
MHPSSEHSAAIPAPVALGLSGPLPAPVPPATAWEWGALIPVTLDGKPRATSSPRAPRRATTVAAPASGHRAALAVVATLAIAAAILSALLV